MSRTSKRDRNPSKPPRPEKESSRDDGPMQLTRPAAKRRPLIVLLVVSVSIAWFAFMVYVAIYR